MTLTFFAALAGAIQMVAPDRWMPASVFSWQRGWGSLKISAFAFAAYTVHVALGFAIFLALSKFLVGVHGEYLGIFTLLFLSAIGIVRVLRFDRFREIVSRSRDSRRVILTLLSLLGPSEMVIPVLMKAHLDGVAPMSALIPLWAGTCIAGLVAVIVSRRLWNKPLMLPRVFQWTGSRVAVLPMSVGALVGIVLISLHSI